MAIVLSQQNIGEYIEKVVPFLAFKVKKVLRVEEVQEETYVNWIFRVDMATAAGDKVIYLRQTRDYVKKKPDIKMDPTRIGFEVRMLNLLQKLIPGVTPEVLHYDSQNNVAVLSDIKGVGSLLVNELVKGNPHVETAGYFGQIVATVHGKTTGIIHYEVRGSAENNEAAIAFHLGMRTKPALEMYPQITKSFLDESRRFHQHLVLGDLASKNIFVDGNKIRFLDLERAFIGDPAFDLAFLFCHYLIEVSLNSLPMSCKFINNFFVSYRQTLRKFLNKPAVQKLEERTVCFLGITILYRIFGFYLAVNVNGNVDFWQERAKFLLEGKYKSLSDALESLS